MPFKKGECGNPSGRPKKDYTLVELTRQHTQAAIDTILAVMSSAKYPADRIKAAEILLDRGWGKAKEQINIDGQVGHMLIPCLIDRPQNETQEQWLARVSARRLIENKSGGIENGEDKGAVLGDGGNKDQH